MVGIVFVLVVRERTGIEMSIEDVFSGEEVRALYYGMVDNPNIVIYTALSVYILWYLLSAIGIGRCSRRLGGGVVGAWFPVARSFAYFSLGGKVASRYRSVWLIGGVLGALVSVVGCWVWYSGSVLLGGPVVVLWWVCVVVLWVVMCFCS